MINKRKRLVGIGCVMLLVFVAVLVYINLSDGNQKHEITLEPYSGDLVGVHAGYAFVPINGQTYRYSSETMDTGGVTRDSLLYECVEVTEFGEEYAWQFYSLKEYPGCERILGVGQHSEIFAYAPAIGADEEEIEDASQSEIALMLNGSVVSGKELWEAFYTKVEKKEKATINLGYVYRNREESMSEELFQATIDDNPSLFLKRLTYDGEAFLLEPLHKEDGEYVVKEVPGYDSPAVNYQYLMHYYGDSPYESALFTYYDKYVLTNDNTVTWEAIEYGMISPYPEDYIDYKEVFCEYQWK